MSTAYILFCIFLLITLPLTYIGFRYIRIKFGFKDNNYSGVQRISRKSPPKKSSEAFLPGSRSGEDSSVEMLKKHLAVDEPRKKKKKQKTIFTSKLDIKRAYIIDAILDKPMWRQNNKNDPDKLD